MKRVPVRNAKTLTVFYVPNNETGMSFIKQAKEYINRGSTAMRVRGRSENRKQFYDETHGRSRTWQSVPKQYASYFAVYIDRKIFEAGEQDNNFYQQINAYKQEYIGLRSQILAAKKEVTQLNLSNSKEVKDKLTSLLVKLDSIRKFFF